MTQPTSLPRYSDKAAVRALCDWMIQKDDALDFKVGSRGWLYLLEDANIISKGQFERALDLIGKCRKDGSLPLEVVAQDEARRLSCLEYLDNKNIADEVADIIDSISDRIDFYKPFSFWDDMPVFLAMMVEKSDLKSLFEPVCRKYFVPLANSKGWSDINLRVNLMRLFKEHEEQGRRCILLYAGDFDPAGLSISDRLKKNFSDLEKAVGWDSSDLTVHRFGLNRDFIEEQGLAWIDNLETARGRYPLDDPRHKDHHLPYVQNYLYRHGVRKCEANALVTRPEAGRKLCEDAILRHLHKAIGEAPVLAEYDQMLEEPRAELESRLKEVLKGWVDQ